MLICVCLRILASSRIPRYDLGRQNPSFLRWFCHSRPTPCRCPTPHLDPPRSSLFPPRLDRAPPNTPLLPPCPPFKREPCRHRPSRSPPHRDPPSPLCRRAAITSLASASSRRTAPPLTGAIPSPTPTTASAAPPPHVESPLG
jgi:hypothetical protein